MQTEGASLMPVDKRDNLIDRLARERSERLVDENALAQLAFQSSPLGAWLLLIGALVVAMFLGNILLSNDPIRGQQIGGAVVYLGWFAFFFYTHEPYAPGRSRMRHLIVAGYVISVVVHISFSMLFPIGSESESSPVILTTALWLVGFAVPVSIIITSARLLVSMENAGQTELGRVIGTSLAMFFLPIGILLLQRRILELRTRGI